MLHKAFPKTEGNCSPESRRPRRGVRRRTLFPRSPAAALGAGRGASPPRSQLCSSLPGAPATRSAVLPRSRAPSGAAGRAGWSPGGPAARCLQAGDASGERPCLHQKHREGHRARRSWSPASPEPYLLVHRSGILHSPISLCFYPTAQRVVGAACF